MLSTETRTPFTFGCRLLAALTLTLTATACDPGDEQVEELALLAEDEALGERSPGADELEDAAPPVGPDVFDSVAPEGSAAHALTHFEWKQGQPPVEMNANNAYFCFLTGVSGKFTSHSESVYIYTVNGSWWLSGSSKQTGVSARAACVLKSDFGSDAYITGAMLVSPTMAPYDFGPANDRVCMLQTVSGNFASPAHRVETYVANGRWYVASSAPSPDIYGMARCIVGATHQGTAVWSAGQPPQLAADQELACGLGRMRGQFQSPDARVDVALVDDQWLVDGNPDTPGASASAHCM